MTRPKVVLALLLAARLAGAQERRVELSGDLTNPLDGRAGAGVALSPPVKVSLSIAPLGPALQGPSIKPTVKAAAAPALVLPGASQAKEEATVVFSAAAPENKSPEVLTSEGRSQFDLQAAPVALGEAASIPEAPSLWSRVASVLTRSDLVPVQPKRGDKVRLSGKLYVVGEKIGEGDGAVVHRVEGRDLVIKFVHPALKDVQVFGGEAGALEAIVHTDIPHARLRARSQDGLVLVKDHVGGETLAETLKRGPLDQNQKEGLADLAARLLRIGHTADLNQGNLIWDRWSQSWTLIDAGGFEAAGAWGPLGQVYVRHLEGSGIDRAWFLSAVRGRLGPDSAAWRSVLDSADEFPNLKKWLGELSARDAARPPPPKIVFEAGATDPALSDEIVPYKEVARRLGYDPLSVKKRWDLKHDKGKLNTVVEKLVPEGQPPRVLKRADLRIIRNEAAVRRMARRFFGKYFDMPRSVGYDAGYESGLAMEVGAGSPSWAREYLDVEHRVALGLMMRTFGVSDVNRDNVLYHGSRATLIDFEQALSPISPAHYIPDESILWELPWVSGREENRIEDYLPAIAAWRALFLKAETQRALEDDLRRCGFAPKEAAAVLATLRQNVSRLEWVLQADAEFANDFIARRRKSG